MGHKKWLTCLCGCLLALLLCAGGIGCFLTAFELGNIHIATVVLWSCFITLCWGSCYTLRLQLIPLCVLALLAGYLWYGGGLAASVEGLLYRVSLYYDNAYNCGVISWSGAYPSEADLMAAVCAAAALITWAVCRTVCAGRPAWLAGVISLIPLAACLVVTDLIPAGLWLWLLLAGEVLLVLPNTLRRRDAVGGTALTALVTVPALLAAALLLGAVPQESYRGQARADAIADRLLQWLPSAQQLEDTVVGVISGALETDSVDLSAVGRRNNTRIEIMRLSGTAQGTVYLRGQHMDGYDGRSWYKSSTEDTVQWLPEAHLLETAGTLQINARYTLPTVYVPYYAQEPGGNWDGARLENESKLKTYTYTYLRLRPDWKSFQADPGAAYSSYLQLSSGTKAWAEALLGDILSENQLPAEKAEAIAGFVRTSAKYDAATERMPSSETDFVRWFLEDSDTGYCVHFASSAVVLLRAAGIPARYVTGYMATLGSNGEAVVRLDDAHAWAEYYVSGVGWVILEATPSYEPPVQQQESQTTATAAPTVPATQPQTEGTVGATLPQKPDIKPGGQTVQPDIGWLKAAFYGLLAALAAAGVLWLQWRLRLTARLHRLQQGDANRRAVALWRETVLLSRLLGQQPPSGLFTIAQRAKFSQHRLTEGELRPLQTYVAEARETLRKKPLYLCLVFQIVFAAC